MSLYQIRRDSPHRKQIPAAMNVIVQFLKFLCYCLITVAEFALMLCLDLVKQLKKPFQ